MNVLIIVLILNQILICGILFLFVRNQIRFIENQRKINELQQEVNSTLISLIKDFNEKLLKALIEDHSTSN